MRWSSAKPKSWKKCCNPRHAPGVAPAPCVVWPAVARRCGTAGFTPTISRKALPCTNHPPKPSGLQCAKPAWT